MTVTSKDGPSPIEDYALIGDCRSAALVGRNGSIDWLCWPHFDSDACFAALLGSPDNGRWLIAPTAGEDAKVTRSYRGDTLILETVFETDEGVVALVDFMPVDPERFAIVRRVEGRRGRMPLRMELMLRFEYGSVTPWVTRLEGEAGVQAVGGPNRVMLRTAVPLHGEAKSTSADFTLRAGARPPSSCCPGSARTSRPSPPSTPPTPWRGRRPSGRSGPDAAPMPEAGARPCCGRS